jgi:hypothetical protein
VEARISGEGAAVRQAAFEGLRDLSASLTTRGFKVIVEEKRWSVVAVTEAAAPEDPHDPLALAYGSAKLVQRVRLAPPPHDGTLYWFWQWSGKTREAPPEYNRCAPHTPSPKRPNASLASWLWSAASER